jgi:hypothetical protein
MRMAEALTVDQLGRGAEDRAHVNMVIYGRSGAGKTFRAATAPSPFILSADPKGHDSIPFQLPGKKVYTVTDVFKVLDWFEGGGHLDHKVRTLIVDGYTFIHKFFEKETGEFMVSSMGAKDADMMPIGGYKKIINASFRLLNRMVNLTQIDPPEYRVHVIITTLEEHLKESDEAQYTVRPVFGTKSMNEDFPAIFSTIGYIVPVGEDAEGEITAQRRMLFTDFRGILARDRLGLFPLKGDAPNLSEYLK